MMQDLKLFMVLIGCKPKGRHTEQHDVFFGIGTTLEALVPQMIAFWPEAEGKIHVDAWREVTQVDGYELQIMLREQELAQESSNGLFFVNLGGYKENEFEEFHYKMLAVGEKKSAVIQQAKQTAFYKHTGFEGAVSHIDDKYGVDVDDIHQIADILPLETKSKYQIRLIKNRAKADDGWFIGYFKLDEL